jgi:hypothetical protein
MAELYLMPIFEPFQNLVPSKRSMPNGLGGG